MNIKIVCVGKIKEAFYRDALLEDQKRLSKYCKLSIIEVSDEKTLDNASENEELLVKNQSRQVIVSSGSYYVDLFLELDLCVYSVDGSMLIFFHRNNKTFLAGDFLCMDLAGFFRFYT